MGIPDFRAMREQVEQMRAQKDAAFPSGSLVQVESERFHGIGIVAFDETCPLEKLAVRVESLNIWWYPIEECKPYSGRMPTWIRSFNRSRRERRVRPAVAKEAEKQRKPKLVKCEGPFCTAVVKEGVVYCDDCKKSNREWEAKQP